MQALFTDGWINKFVRKAFRIISLPLYIFQLKIILIYTTYQVEAFNFQLFDVCLYKFIWLSIVWPTNIDCSLIWLTNYWNYRLQVNNLFNLLYYRIEKVCQSIQTVLFTGWVYLMWVKSKNYGHRRVRYSMLKTLLFPPKNTNNLLPLEKITQIPNGLQHIYKFFSCFIICNCTCTSNNFLA